MKLLFCYDGPIVKDEDNNYYGTALNDEMFKRYDCITNELTIAIRVNSIDSKNIQNKYTKITKEKYSIIECPNLSSIRGMFFYRKQCQEILEEQIKQSDGLIVRLPSFIGNLAIKLAQKYNKPYLVEMVGCPWDAFWNHSLKGKIIAPYMYMKTKLNVRKAKYVLYVTEKFLQTRYPTKGLSIACSNVILEDIKDDVLVKRERRIENIECKKISIATTAAIDVKYKGQQYVIKAISKLKEKGYNIEYYLMGKGDNTFLKNIAQKHKVIDNINFLGPLAHQLVFDMLDEIDVYIQPSKQEGLPRALIEAMSRGCLCIGSNAGGTPELLKNKYIFKKGKVKELVKILESLQKVDYQNESKINIEKSKEYNKNILEKRRTDFFIKYRNDSLNYNK